MRFLRFSKLTETASIDIFQIWKQQDTVSLILFHMEIEGLYYANQN